ncbi:MAG: 50S ribosomal protein L25 [Anaerolineae bacterium]|jgi:large subunit ribosomal protein L25
MERIELKTSSRQILGKKVKHLRAEGVIPGVLFGAKVPTTHIQVDERDLSKALQEAGATALIDLYVDDNPEPHVVLAREIQRDILTSRLQHVDFYQVQLDRMVKTMPALEIVGQSPLVESGAAVLVRVLTQIEVECLPTDLIDSIEVDVTSLETLNDSITLADLDVPPGVRILADPSDVVASVVPPRAALEEIEPEEEELEEMMLGEVELGEDEEEAGEFAEEDEA